DQFRHVSANALGVAGAPANFDANIAALDPARLRQRLRERQDAGLLCWIVRRKGREHANAPHPIRLLCTCRQRPCGCRAAEQGDEIAPPHGGLPQGQGSLIKYSRSGPCIAAKAASQCPLGVKSGKAQNEQTLSALPPNVANLALSSAGLACEFGWSASPALPWRELRHRRVGTNACRNAYAGQATTDGGHGRAVWQAASGSVRLR